ncbi:hypothetical protein M949_1576 [Riemerella anatipestifer CH3]|nr:hypothetical protein M949_1576 [Riemerella anatipestifer CH3]
MYTHTQVVSWVCVRLFRKLLRLLSLNQNIIPPTFVGGFWRLSYSNFSFHQYLLKAPLFCLKTWSFLLGAFSVQKGSFCFLSALAFPLVLCVFRGGRRFLISSKSFSLRFKVQSLRGKCSMFMCLRFKVQIFKESSELLNYAPRTLNLESLNFEPLNLQPLIATNHLTINNLTTEQFNN